MQTHITQISSHQQNHGKNWKPSNVSSCLWLGPQVPVYTLELERQELYSMNIFFEVSLENHWKASATQSVRRAWCWVLSTSQIPAPLMLHHTEIWYRETILEGIHMEPAFQTKLSDELLHEACGERGVSDPPKAWDLFVHNSLALLAALHPPSTPAKGSPKHPCWPTYFQVCEQHLLLAVFSLLCGIWLC